MSISLVAITYNEEEHIEYWYNHHKELANEILANYPISDKKERLDRAKIVNQLIEEGNTYQDIVMEQDEE